MSIKIITQPIKLDELKEIAKEEFGNVIKAVVDVKQEIMAVGGELHSDEEVMLMENENSKRENTWGINIRLDESEDEFVEFNSMINIKPSFGNNSRGVDSPETREKIKAIVKKLVTR